MRLDDAERILQTYLATNWAGTPLSFEATGESDESMVGNPYFPAGESDYVHVRIYFAGSVPATAYRHRRRVTGFLLCAVCYRSGDGTRGATALASDLIALLEAQELVDTDGQVLRIQEVASIPKYTPTEGWRVIEPVFAIVFDQCIAQVNAP